jgi:hypothetical protein
MHLHNTNITLKSLQFQHATLCRDEILVEYGGKFGVSFKLSNQTEAHYYVYDGQQKSEVEYERIEDLPTISIESFTEKILNLDDDIEMASFLKID